MTLLMLRATFHRQTSTDSLVVNMMMLHMPVILFIFNLDIRRHSMTTAIGM